jgi:hypothetical protein
VVIFNMVQRQLRVIFRRSLCFMLQRGTNVNSATSGTPTCQ